MPERGVSFASDIRPLFRSKDVDSMKRARNLDLSSYDDVKAHSDDILDRLRAGNMPLRRCLPNGTRFALREMDFWRQAGLTVANAPR
jgi:hypothetical protein